MVELFNQFDATYEFLGNDGARFYFLTDLDAPLQRVIAVDLTCTQPGREIGRN